MTSNERREISAELSPEKKNKADFGIGALVAGMWDEDTEKVLACVTSILDHFNTVSDSKFPLVETLIEHNGFPKMVELMELDASPDIQDQAFRMAKAVVLNGTTDQLTLLLDTGIWSTCINIMMTKQGKVSILSEMLLGLVAIKRPELAEPLVSVFLQGIQSPDKDAVFTYIEKATSIVCWSRKSEAVIPEFFAQDGANKVFETVKFVDRPDIQIRACELMNEIFIIDKHDLTFLMETDVHLTLMALLESDDPAVTEAGLDTMFLIARKVASFQDRLVEMGLVGSLIRLVSRNDAESLLESVACWFHHLCDRQQTLSVQALIGCMSALKLIMMCQTLQAVCYACVTLSNVTGGNGQMTETDRFMCQSVVDSGFVPWLLRVLYRDDTRIKLASATALYNISRAGSDQLIALLVKDDAFHILLDIIHEKDDSDKLARLGIKILENILRYGERIDQFEILWEIIMDLGLEIRFGAFLESLDS